VPAFKAIVGVWLQICSKLWQRNDAQMSTSSVYMIDNSSVSVIAKSILKFLNSPFVTTIVIGRQNKKKKKKFQKRKQERRMTLFKSLIVFGILAALAGMSTAGEG
jgi:K+-sensing histidine kinase KdpD